MIQAIPYWWSILFSLGVVGSIALGGPWSWLGVVILFVFHPLLDFLLGRRREGLPAPSANASAAFEVLILITPVIVFAVIFYGLVRFQAEGSVLARIGLVISVGLVSGFLGIATAHELVHRLSGWHRFLGYVLLWQVNFGHWAVEHVFGHHKHVGTKEDPATPSLNEWLYPYWLRTYFVGMRNAWRFESDRLKRRTAFERLTQNRVLGSWVVQLALAASLWELGGWPFLAFWWGQSVVAVLLLKTVDYIEHYGLVREIRSNGLPVPVQDIHSWDCDYRLTNWTLLNLGYHAHHHMKPLVKYQDLVTSFGRKRMPFGYSTMFILALVPPLYFQLMNGRLKTVDPT